MDGYGVEQNPEPKKKRTQMDERVLLLYSGGRDSTLSACKLVEQQYHVILITFDNGLGYNISNTQHGANRLIERYGNERVENLGVYNTIGIWRDFLIPYYNLKPSEIENEYGELTISQFHCLSCRASMYILSIIKARQLDIKVIADGARKSQGFVIETDPILSRIRKLVQTYSIELVTPVYDLESDWDRKNSLLNRGFVPKTLEPQCLVGVPLPEHGPLDEDVIEAASKFFDIIIVPRAKAIIEAEANLLLDSRGEL